MAEHDLNMGVLKNNDAFYQMNDHCPREFGHIFILMELFYSGLLL